MADSKLDSKTEIKKLLQATPLDKGGVIKRDDLKKLLGLVVKDTVSEAELQRALEISDPNGTGDISIEGFLTWIYGAGGALMSAIQWVDNIILLSDSYKISHWKQYPPGTEYVYSYFESRGCDRAGWDSVCFFGLQYFLKRYMVGSVVTKEKIDEAEKIYSIHFGDGVNENPALFYREGWEYILKQHNGKLPVHIKAVPEGMVVPNKCVLFTMVNTDPKCYWLTNFLETLLVQVWYPMTVCTNSRMQKLSIHKYLEDTGNQDWSIPGGSVFKLHDFGFRGVSSVESAAAGGCGHLVNFLGTDTVAAMVCAQTYYGAGIASGHSIPASEHSTITSWGVDGEVDAMENML
jgi:nicotinamide phosphoribosyltransferase